MANDLLCDLYEKIQNEKIIIFSADTGEHKAVTIKHEYENRYGIFCDERKFANSAEEFIVMAHEYGHCKTGSTHKLYSPYQLVEQHETRANRAAVHEFSPVEKIEEAVNYGNTELSQIAEYLSMPEEFVSMAIETYRLEGELD